MPLLAQLLLEGLLLGSFYAFLSLGFSLTWGVLNILNVAYGSLVVLGSYLSYTLLKAFGIDPVLSIPRSFGVGFGVGFLIQRVLLGRVMRLDPFMVLILTFGLDVLISHTLNYLFKGDIRSIDVPYAEGSYLLAGIIISKVKLLVFILSLLLTLALFIFLRYTWSGKAIRAVALDAEGARLVGIGPERVFALTLGIGTGIAFSSGNLYGILQGFTPFDGELLTVKAFLVSVLGGLGRVESALLGGVFLGGVEVFVSFYIGESWKIFASLVLMVLVLVFRPRGLIGGKYYGQA